MGRSVQVKTRKYWAMFRRAFIDPLKIVLYLQFPAVAISVYYATVTFMALYMLNISVQETFSAAPYNYNSIIVGLLYLPNSAGYFLSSLFGGKWVDRIMIREAKKSRSIQRRRQAQIQAGRPHEGECLAWR